MRNSIGPDGDRRLRESSTTNLIKLGLARVSHHFVKNDDIKKIGPLY